MAGLSLESKEKSEIETNKTKSININEKEINDDDKDANKNNIPISNFIIKEIEKDGNCFYRTISYYYRNTPEDYAEFRELITSYIINNPDDYIFCVTDEDIDAHQELD